MLNSRAYNAYTLKQTTQRVYVMTNEQRYSKINALSERMIETTAEIEIALYEGDNGRAEELYSEQEHLGMELDSL